ncbi:transporter [Pseudobacteriovorax antillogorgiicola]|uniref:Putative MetA-pathway of phenol degradation n=1 Tax=Pseudobacteriovorax antillogorgiicola TaxID=1513793 RepID=A0A1Y6B2M3_9BACT|nr:transporter [Pseudobacteriovorax antillogorgiicola]TCS59431.1 outer membrane putative beta-barrel porin/alpha-amylase [Pseudobacteriovorax antillogorgiicola]SME88334.1 Putative MetA-pathway of phenol degradation [Pseudobacteriovorax antillogorgiicola]
MKRITVMCLAMWVTSPIVQAFESTKVLPKGIRNLNLRTIYTQTSTKTNKDGNIEPLAEPLWKPLRFRNILSSETGLKKKQLQALMLQQGWSEEDTVGDFYAELEAQINVWAPIFAFGVSERVTLAAALPVYSASTDIQVGFRTNEGADNFIGALTDPAMSNNKSAIEAAEKLQNAIPRLNEKLLDNSYDPLEKWNGTGIGDLTLLAKYLAVDGEIFKAALSGGVTIPTGDTENPDILTDLPFGDGQWDIISQLTFDQFITSNLMLNQFYKYTYQAPGNKPTRLKTGDETIEVELVDLDYKLGDKVDAGVSLQYEQPGTGIQAGLGLLAYRKFGDRYETDDLPAKDELQRATAHEANYWQAKLGYSSLEAFRRGEIAVPLMASIEYRKQTTSRNVPRTDFTQVDIRLFF